jgi:peptidoglycan/xylan/chitin deacetylase (PgdA/CDA1 family)
VTFDPTRRDLVRLAGAATLLSIPPRRALAGGPAAVSLTYDDGLHSQLDHAVPQLDRLGLKATFFLTQDNMRDDLVRWQAAAAAGHEMANHTITHPCDLRAYDETRLVAEELAPMEAYLDASFPRPKSNPRFRAYAYPCDGTALGRGHDRERRYARLVEASFAAARTTDGPPNDPAVLRANRGFLNGFEPTEHADTPRLAIAYLKQAIARGHWAILIFHEVLPSWRGTGDCGAATHQAILDWIVAHPIRCAPMGRMFRSLTGEA